MSDELSARLNLPLLQPGQAQKEIDHNEALALLDIAVDAIVVTVGLDTPPGAPAAGDCWIVGTAPTGAWAGHAGALAGWTAGGWRFVAPRDGMSAWSIAAGCRATRSGGTWTIGTVAAQRVTIGGTQVIGAQRPAIADPTGGATPDTAARTAIVSILAALRAHGLIAP